MRTVSSPRPGLNMFLGDHSCPNTGKCVEKSNLSQNCDCYTGENITVCPYCNATTTQSHLTYQYVESLSGQSRQELSGTLHPS